MGTFFSFKWMFQTESYFNLDLNIDVRLSDPYLNSKQLL